MLWISSAAYRNDSLQLIDPHKQFGSYMPLTNNLAATCPCDLYWRSSQLIMQIDKLLMWIKTGTKQTVQSNGMDMYT